MAKVQVFGIGDSHLENEAPLDHVLLSEGR